MYNLLIWYNFGEDPRSDRVFFYSSLRDSSFLIIWFCTILEMGVQVAPAAHCTPHLPKVVLSCSQKPAIGRCPEQRGYK
jgi:hypothetical protein